MARSAQRAGVVVTTALAATLFLASCAQSAPEPQVRPAEVAQPSAPAATGQTRTADPRLDRLAEGLIRPEQVPGWEQVLEPREPLDIVIEPAACQLLFDQVLAKNAGPEGTTVTYRRDGVTVQQWIEYLDPGQTPVIDLQQVAGNCQAFTLNDAGERTPATTSPVEVPRLGERRLAIKLVVRPEDPIHVAAMWVLHGDTLMTVVVEGATTPTEQLQRFAALGYANQRTLS